MDRTAALAALKSALDSGGLAEKDRGFAESLVSQSAARGLSDKQWYWVAKLAAGIAGEDKREVGGFERVYAMFQKAKEHLKHPKVILQCSSGLSIKIYLSGAMSRVPDTVNVVSNDSDTWFGRVYADGRWEGGRGNPEAVQEVEGMLKQFASSPEEVASAHGKLTGNCCFCHRPLTDERSTDVGYGPVCASRYGLSWGGKK